MNYRYIKTLALVILAYLSVLSVALPATAFAAVQGAPHIEGTQLSLVWAIPFAGILFSIALLPLLAPSFWHHNFGKVSAFWAIAFLLPCLLLYGWDVALFTVLETALHEYIPFIILLFALFTIAGGVRVTGRLKGTPIVNTGILFVGTIIASWMGTTGAAMLLIRPLLNANEDRKHKVHIVVFFIFLPNPKNIYMNEGLKPATHTSRASC